MITRLADWVISCYWHKRGYLELRWIPNGQALPKGFMWIENSTRTHHNHYARLAIRKSGI